MAKTTVYKVHIGTPTTRSTREGQEGILDKGERIGDDLYSSVDHFIEEYKKWNGISNIPQLKGVTEIDRQVEDGRISITLLITTWLRHHVAIRHFVLVPMEVEIK